MKRIPILTIAGALIVLCAWRPAHACPPPHRDRAQMRAFERAHPCPATEKTYGACPQFVVDHRRPLCASGADLPANMVWQPLAESKIKDREEAKLCALMRARNIPSVTGTAALCKMLDVADYPLTIKAMCPP